MARLLEDLLDVSRITRDKLELRKEIVALDEVIRKAVEISRPLIEEKGHNITQTGWGREEDREQSWHAGFDYHLTEPIDHHLLEKILLETALPQLKQTGEKSQEIYRDYLITSRAMYETASSSWMPVVTLTWRHGKDFHLHKLNASRMFDVQADAIAEGFVMGRHWIDQQL
jgi:hypothetical protein